MSHIQIVDDPATQTHILNTMLEKNGISTFIAEDGKVGVSKIKNLS